MSEPTEDEPAKSEPKKDDAATSEPAKSDAAASKPAASKPAESTPAETEAKRPDQADSKPAKKADAAEKSEAAKPAPKPDLSDEDLVRATIPPERNASRNGFIRIGMLVVIALVMLENAAGWVDPDLWIPFVCIIAVMGIGTRGGPLESLSFVVIEAAVVLVLGVATFSGSRDFVWAASVAVSLVAIGKVAFLEVQRRDLAAAEKAAEDAERKLRQGKR